MLNAKLIIKPLNSDFINFLRFVAAQCVLLGHMEYHYFDGHRFLNSVAKPTFVVFILLSGYLISITTFRKMDIVPNYNFKQFFIERTARIYTTFLPALVFGALVDVFHSHYTHSVLDYELQKALDLRYWLVNLFQFQNHAVLDLIRRFDIYEIPFFTTLGTNRPLWSLSFEFWLYLFFGWWVLIKKKKWWFGLLWYFFP